MLSHFRSALVLTAVMTVLTGIAYPLAVTGIAGVAFPGQARGSLIERDGRIVGSALIGQDFTGPAYVHGRPSSAGAGYDAVNSGGSNLAPSARTLVERVTARIAALRASDPGGRGRVPADLVTASGSGLDPHVSPAAAMWQAARVAEARGVPADEVRLLIAANVEGRTFGLLGEPRVNVLVLNLALDERWPKR